MSGPFGWGGERGVSDVLAFIIVFSIIITSVALVYGTGFSSIKQVAAGEQKANAERAFEAVALSMEDIVDGQAPRRGGSLNLGGGQLQVDDSTTLTVWVDGNPVTPSSVPFPSPNGAVTVGSFEFYDDDTAVAYENGGVFRRDGSASVTVRRPTVTCTSERAIVSIVRVESPDGAIGASDNVEITMVKVEESSSLLYSDSDGSTSNTVEVQVSNTDFAPAWERTLDETFASDVTRPDSTTVTTDPCSTERVVVRLVTIEVTYDAP